MTQVQVDWLTLALAPVVVISLSLAFYATRRKSSRETDGPRVPTWGRVAQTVGIISAVCLGFIQLMWGN